MNSHNIVVLQLALRPMMVVAIQGTEFEATEVADFSEFFEAVKKLALTNETKLLVNRGPGSYSGIRTTIAYAFGLIHGSRVNAQNLHSFTSFELISAATNHTGPIYLKSWPRVATGNLAASKGYFSETPEDTGRYAAFEEVSSSQSILSVGEEEIATKLEYRQLRELLSDPIGYRELAQNIEELSTDLEPLYINPVHIT